MKNGQIVKITFFIAIAVFLITNIAFSKDAEVVKKDENVCISCHTSLKGVTGKGGKDLSEPVALWDKSWHKEMGNTCDGCHGGDPTNSDKAMAKESGFLGVPDKGKVADFCGKCHIGIVENFKKSPHFTSQKSIKPDCVTCHNAHDNKKASIELISEKLCTQCHSFDRAKKIKESLSGAEAAVKKASQDVEELKEMAYDVKGLEDTLFAARNMLRQKNHILDVEDIALASNKVFVDVDKVNKKVSELKKEDKKRKIWGSITMVFFIFVSALIILYRKTFLGPTQK